jgi:hypothetical protein
MEKTYLILDFDNIYKSYPLSVKAIAQWLVNRKDVKENLQFLLDDTKQDPEELFMEKIVPPMVQHDGRKLYDFFDVKDIYINISKGNNGWTYWIGESPHDTLLPTRIEAEEGAFRSAFEILESRLK